jgi:hypothetical protein
VNHFASVACSEELLASIVELDSQLPQLTNC